MSYIPICVRVALAASDEQSILDILATDEIHMEDRNRGLAWTKLNSGIYTTQNSLQNSEQLHLNKAKLWRSTIPYLDQ